MRSNSVLYSSSKIRDKLCSCIICGRLSYLICKYDETIKTVKWWCGGSCNCSVTIICSARWSALGRSAHWSAPGRGQFDHVDDDPLSFLRWTQRWIKSSRCREPRRRLSSSSESVLALVGCCWDLWCICQASCSIRFPIWPSVPFPVCVRFCNNDKQYYTRSDIG